MNVNDKYPQSNRLLHNKRYPFKRFFVLGLIFVLLVAALPLVSADEDEKMPNNLNQMGHQAGSDLEVKQSRTPARACPLSWGRFQTQ
jgi:hypothetical protein